MLSPKFSSPLPPFKKSGSAPLYVVSYKKITKKSYLEILLYLLKFQNSNVYIYMYRYKQFNRIHVVYIHDFAYTRRAFKLTKSVHNNNSTCYVSKQPVNYVYL